MEFSHILYKISVQYRPTNASFLSLYAAKWILSSSYPIYLDVFLNFSYLCPDLPCFLFPSGFPSIFFSQNALNTLPNLINNVLCLM
jgi:hypothetical protein